MKTTHKRQAAVAVLGFMAALVVAGCSSTPDSRIKKQESAFAAMPVEVQAKIRAGTVEVGYTPQQVTLARGKPDRVGKRTTATGTDEVWTYEKRASGLGFGIGVGGGSGGMGGGVGVGTGGGSPEVELRVVFSGGVVSAVEDYRKK